MKPVNQLVNLQKLFQGPTSEKPKPLKGIDFATWEIVWSRLELAKVVWEAIDSTTSEYWRTRLDGFSVEDVMRGCDAADHWAEPKSLTIGAFEKLCKRPIADPSHNLYQALGVKAIEPDDHHRRTEKMKEELGL